jgi:ABC-2 type transport system ATP-binding protein
MLAELRADGTALLQSTHQLEEVEQACDRIVIVDHGRVVAEGELDELVTGALGGARRVELLLAREPGAAEVPPGFRADGLRMSGALEEVARELPELLSRLSKAGHEVRDLRVEAPSLESVLLALTGGELRE